MKTYFQKAATAVRKFGNEEEGAQVVEYALIIAVVSIGLIVALGALKGTSFSTFITKVGTCLSGTCT